MPTLRYEIAIPLEDNLGHLFVQNELQITLREIGDKFAGYSIAAPRRGYWRASTGKEYFTHETLVTVDVEDTAQNREWFEQKRIEWRQRFRQEDFYIVFHAINSLLTPPSS